MAISTETTRCTAAGEGFFHHDRIYTITNYNISRNVARECGTPQFAAHGYYTNIHHYPHVVLQTNANKCYSGNW